MHIALKSHPKLVHSAIIHSSYEGKITLYDASISEKKVAVASLRKPVAIKHFTDVSIFTDDESQDFRFILTFSPKH